MNIDAAAESPEATTPPKPAKKTKAARAPKVVREQAQVAFPYVDADAAISVVQALFGAGGVPLTRDQLAGAMKLAPASGGFAWKVGAARLYGLIEQKDGRNSLTDLGFAVVDEARGKEARAQAFLNVPLYRRVYDEFKGKQLPPRPHGLAQAFVRFGVPAKQRDKARLAFERAARQTGFFDHGSERLVEPIITGGAAPLSDRGNEPPPMDRNLSRAPAPQRKGYHPFIEGLLESLPAPQAVWPQAERTKWLRAAADIFELMYRGEQNATPGVQIGSEARDLQENKPTGPEPIRG